jgi:hypothetical protein
MSPAVAVLLLLLFLRLPLAAFHAALGAAAMTEGQAGLLDCWAL